MAILSRNTKKVNNKYYISHRDKYYKDGNPFGKWTFYNENGDVVKFENY